MRLYLEWSWYIWLYSTCFKRQSTYILTFTYAKFNTVYQIFSDDELGIAAFISIFSSSAFEFLIFDGKKNIFLIQCIFHKLSIYIFSKLLYVWLHIYRVYVYSIFWTKHVFCHGGKRRIYMNFNTEYLGLVVDAKSILGRRSYHFSWFILCKAGLQPSSAYFMLIISI